MSGNNETKNGICFAVAKEAKKKNSEIKSLFC